jgi:hypothetical protein
MLYSPPTMGYELKEGGLKGLNNFAKWKTI